VEQLRQTVKRHLNQKKPEVGREVCNLCSVVTETFGVLSLFRVMHCYSYSKIKGVIINCNSAWRIFKSRTHKLFVALPSKHATITSHTTYITSKLQTAMDVVLKSSLV
jgi:hypothetical protein